MKKVGILTYHHAINYGANLQAYALWQSVKKQGYDVEFIDYRPVSALKNYFMNRYFWQNLIKSRKLDNFLVYHTKLGKSRTYHKSDLKQKYFNYDIIISGSDEVWNINSFRGYDPAYFLDFINQGSSLKISYAASFGSTVTLGLYREKISQLLNQFTYISVRDANTLNLVTEECNCKAIQVLDPTFLADYSQVISPVKEERAYLLIYGFKLNEVEEKLVKLLAKNMGLMIVSIGFYSPIADKNLVNIGTEQWLGYFQKATYVLTSFYHGTIFSIIFKKPFVALSRGDKTIKVHDLLNDLDLENRIFYQTSDINKFVNQNLEINYQHIINNLAKKVLLSRKFLMEALNG
jgi:hypothetical protein